MRRVNEHLGPCVISCVPCSEISSAVAGNERQTGSSGSSFSGVLTISEGARFSEELRNRSSVHFKVLAFDTERLVSHLYYGRNPE